MAPAPPQRHGAVWLRDVTSAPQSGLRARSRNTCQAATHASLLLALAVVRLTFQGIFKGAAGFARTHGGAAAWLGNVLQTVDPSQLDPALCCSKRNVSEACVSGEANLLYANY